MVTRTHYVHGTAMGYRLLFTIWAFKVQLGPNSAWARTPFKCWSQSGIYQGGKVLFIFGVWWSGQTPLTFLHFLFISGGNKWPYFTKNGSIRITKSKHGVRLCRNNNGKEIWKLFSQQCTKTTSPCTRDYWHTGLLTFQRPVTSCIEMNEIVTFTLLLHVTTGNKGNKVTPCISVLCHLAWHFRPVPSSSYTPEGLWEISYP